MPRTTTDNKTESKTQQGNVPREDKPFTQGCLSATVPGEGNRAELYYNLKDVPKEIYITEAIVKGLTEPPTASEYGPKPIKRD